MDLPTLTPGYSALRDGAAWLDLSGRGKIRVTGDDRARLLHAMTTNHIQQLKPGEGCYAFFLNAQGRILGDVNIFCFEDHFLLDTEPETRQKLFEHLDRYIIADDVTVEDVSDRLATIAVEGPKAGEVLLKLDTSLPKAPYSTVSWENSTIARVSSTGPEGYFVFVPVGEEGALLSKLAGAGAVSATADDARTVRIEHGKPRYGEEITERYLVQETEQMHAVHFSKGCYLGQEIVERVRSRAQIHRVLHRVEIDSAEPPESGAKLTSGEEAAGEIASAAFSPSLGKSVALAYVRIQFAEPGTELTLENSKVRVA